MKQKTIFTNFGNIDHLKVFEIPANEWPIYRYRPPKSHSGRSLQVRVIIYEDRTRKPCLTVPERNFLCAVNKVISPSTNWSRKDKFIHFNKIILFFIKLYVSNIWLVSVSRAFIERSFHSLFICGWWSFLNVGGSRKCESKNSLGVYEVWELQP